MPAHELVKPVEPGGVADDNTTNELGETINVNDKHHSLVEIKGYQATAEADSNSVVIETDDGQVGGNDGGQWCSESHAHGNNDRSRYGESYLGVSRQLRIPSSGESAHAGSAHPQGADVDLETSTGQRRRERDTVPPVPHPADGRERGFRRRVIQSQVGPINTSGTQRQTESVNSRIRRFLFIQKESLLFERSGPRLGELEALPPPDDHAAIEAIFKWKRELVEADSPNSDEHERERWARLEELGKDPRCWPYQRWLVLAAPDRLSKDQLSEQCQLMRDGPRPKKAARSYVVEFGCPKRFRSAHGRVAPPPDGYLNPPPTDAAREIANP